MLIQHMSPLVRRSISSQSRALTAYMTTRPTANPRMSSLMAVAALAQVATNWNLRAIVG